MASVDVVKKIAATTVEQALAYTDEISLFSEASSVKGRGGTV